MDKHLSDEIILNILERTEGESPSERKHLESCSLCQERMDEFSKLLDLMGDSAEKQPDERVRWEIEAAIATEKKSLPHRFSFNTLQLAAAIALLIIGYGWGSWIKNSDVNEELMVLQQEIRDLREVTLTGKLQKHSASERIYAVNRVENEIETPGEDLIRTLIETLNLDESPNVRYAALQALGKFIDHKFVREALVISLKQQTDPLIQISLISLLVQAEEKSAVAPIRDLLREESTVPEVRRQAEIALKVLI